MPSTSEPIHIFVCYSHSPQDRRWVDDKSDHLLIPWLQRRLREYNVELWWDREQDQGIRGGEAWKQKIFEEIARAHIAILLVSEDFAASEFILQEELPRIRCRLDAGELSLLPILVSRIGRTTRHELAWIVGHQMIPSDQKSLTDCTRHDADWDEVKTQIIDELIFHLERIRQEQKPPAALPIKHEGEPITTAASPPSPTVFAPHSPDRPAAERDTKREDKQSAPLLVTDTAGRQTPLREFGIVYRPFASNTLANSLRDSLVVEEGKGTRKIPWKQINAVHITAMNDASVVLQTGNSLDGLKLRGGSLVGMDANGLEFSISLADVRMLQHNPAGLAPNDKDVPSSAPTPGPAPKCQSSPRGTAIRRFGGLLASKDPTGLPSSRGTAMAMPPVPKDRAGSGPLINNHEEPEFFFRRRKSVFLDGPPPAAMLPDNRETVRIIAPQAQINRVLREDMASGRGCFAEQEATLRDKVNSTVFAPPETSPGNPILVQVYVHIPECAGEAQAQAQEFDSAARRRGVTSLGTEIKRGSKLAFELTMKGALLNEPYQELVWIGNTESVQFEVTVPHTQPPGTLIGKVLVSQDSIPIGRILFKLEVIAAREEVASPKPPTTCRGTATRYNQAFISYASEDRDEVLRRVQMLQAVGIRYFQDVLDLEPGDHWAQELYHRIDESDVMFLFWSSAARDSVWVRKEWQYGLKTKGEDFVRPVIIEGPPPPEPPKELQHLHFSDRVLYFLNTGLP